MRHLAKGKKFGRIKGQRVAFVRSLCVNFIAKQKIKTTDTRAKTVRSEVEKLITLAKKQTVASLRLLIARVGKKSATTLFYEIAPRYADRSGGYVRITKVSKRRVGDAARMSYVEFV